MRIFAADSLLALNRFRLREVWKQALEDESTYVIEIASKALQDLQNYGNILPKEAIAFVEGQSQ